MEKISNKQAFTLTEILFVVAIILVLTLIAIPNLTNTLTNTRANSCIDNLRQIKLAKEQWALENNKVSTDVPVAADLNLYVNGTTTSLFCPLDPNRNNPGTRFGTSYTINNVGTDPACKISAATHHL